MLNIQLTELNNSSIHKTSGKICFILLQREKRKKSINKNCFSYASGQQYSQKQMYSQSSLVLRINAINNISLSKFHFSLLPTHFFFVVIVVCRYLCCDLAVFSSTMRRQICSDKRKPNHKLPET